jgi:hypothetical protein
MPDTVIAQTTAEPAQPAPSPEFPALGSGTVWAIVGSVFTVAIQQAFNSFNRKEQQESDLVRTLVEGLQKNQERLLNQQYEVIQELKDAVNDLGNTVKNALEAYDREMARMEHRLKNLENRK